MTDGQDIFDSEVPPQTTEGVSPEAPASQPRDDAGRFAAKDTGDEAPAQPVATGEPPAPAEKRHDVPITALLDEREKRQRLEAQLLAMQAQLQQHQQPQTMPDPVEDAEGYHRALSQTFEQRMVAERLRQSQFFAEREFGKDMIAELMAFFDNQPRAVSAQFLAAPSPFHAAVEWFKGQKELQSIGNPSEYRAKVETELRASIEAELREKILAEMQPARRLSPSLAAASGSGREPPGAGVDPLFS